MVVGAGQAAFIASSVVVARASLVIENIKRLSRGVVGLEQPEQPIMFLRGLELGQ